MQNKILSFIMLAIILTSCSYFNTPLTQTANKSIGKNERSLDKAESEINILHDAIKKRNLNFDSDAIYINDASIMRKNNGFLPPVFNHTMQVDQTFYSITEISSLINQVTGYPVLLDLKVKPDVNVRVIQNRGSLIDLLNNICARTDLSWRFASDKIILSDSETKTWFLHALPGENVVSSQLIGTDGVNALNSNSNNGSGGGGGIASGAGGAGGIGGVGGVGGVGGGGSSGGGSSGGGSSGGSNGNPPGQNATHVTQFNLNGAFWSNLNDTVKSMLSTTGTVNILPATSSVTVTDRPSVILRVDNFISQQNKSLKRQVQIDVQVLSVETNKEDDYGINWNLAFQGTNGNFYINGIDGSGVTSNSTAAGAAANAAATANHAPVPIFTPTSTTQSFSIAGAPGSSLSGSQILLQALSTIAKVSVVTATSASTLNNQPVPIEFVDSETYVAGYQTNFVGTISAQAQTNLITNNLSYGFMFHILPNIEDNGTVNLQIAMSMSQLKSMPSKTIQGQYVQLPNMVQRDTMQKVTLKSGETYVVTGFDEDQNQVMNTGVGSAFNWLLGGGVQTKTRRIRLVLLVTPRVM